MDTLSSRMPPGLEDASSALHIKDGNASLAAAESKVIVRPSFSEDFNSVSIFVGSPDNHEQLTYNTGYGDMCFGRAIEREAVRHLADRHIAWNSAYNEPSNNTPLVEPDNFTRSGQFPFMKLPVELRLEIFLLLLGPFFQKDIDLNAMCIEIEVRHHSFRLWDEKYYQDDYQAYLDVCARQTSSWNNLHPHGDSANPIPKTMEDRFGSEAEFERKRWIHKQLQKPHPLRRCYYTADATPTINDSGIKKDWGMMKLVQTISNVSRRVRNELSTVFWTRVNIICPEYTDFLALQWFLDDRPLASKGIKSLCLDVDLDHSKESDLLSAFQRLSESLDLEAFKISLYLDETDLEGFSSGKGRILWLTNIWNMKVSSHFDLKLLHVSPATPIVTLGDVEEYQEVQVDKYEFLLEEYLKPKTLIGKPAPSTINRRLREIDHLMRGVDGETSDSESESESDSELSNISEEEDSEFALN